MKNNNNKKKKTKKKKKHNNHNNSHNQQHFIRQTFGILGSIRLRGDIKYLLAIKQPAMKTHGISPCSTIDRSANGGFA
jgi:hypothetical protein